MLSHIEMSPPNKRVDTNRRQALPRGARRKLESAFSGPPSLSATVGHPQRWANLRAMRKTKLMATGLGATALIALAITLRLLNPAIEIHGSLSASDVVQIRHLVEKCQRTSLLPLSMDAVRQRFFQPIQCIYASPDGQVHVVCRLRKHAYDGYSRHYEFTRDSREPSGWRSCGQGAGNRGHGFL